MRSGPFRDGAGPAANDGALPHAIDAGPAPCDRATAAAGRGFREVEKRISVGTLCALLAIRPRTLHHYCVGHLGISPLQWSCGSPGWTRAARTADGGRQCHQHRRCARFHLTRLLLRPLSPRVWRKSERHAAVDVRFGLSSGPRTRAAAGFSCNLIHDAGFAGARIPRVRACFWSFPSRTGFMRAITAWLCNFGKLLPGCRGGPSEAIQPRQADPGRRLSDVERQAPGAAFSAVAVASAAASSPRAGCPGSARKSALKSGPALRRPGHSWPVDRPRWTRAEHPADRAALRHPLSCAQQRSVASYDQLSNHWCYRSAAKMTA